MSSVTVDEILADIRIHLHLSKESEHEVLAEVRTHLEDVVADAQAQGVDEQKALLGAVQEFGIPETGSALQEVHARWESTDAVAITALPIFFTVLLRWLTFSPDGAILNWQQLLVRPGFYIVALAALALPFLIFRRWRYALVGWGLFWLLSVIFVIFPSINRW